MKININTQKLRQAFSLALQATARNSVREMLKYVKLEALDFGCYLTSTDSEIVCRIKVDCEVVTPGVCLLPPLLQPAIATANCTDLVLESTGSGVQLVGDRFKTKLSAPLPNEYPIITFSRSETARKISAADLSYMIEQVGYAIDEQSSRYALGGVQIEFSAEHTTAIATDGKRLAKAARKRELSESESESSNAIIPGRALKLIAKAIENETEIEARISSNEIQFDGERIAISARQIEGRFPDWKRVVPKQDYDDEFRLNSKEFLSSLNQASIVTTDESKGVTISISAGQVSIAANATQVGESEVSLLFDNQDITKEICIDPQLVVDFLRVNHDAEIKLNIKDKSKPLVMECGDSLLVVMPLNKDR